MNHQKTEIVAVMLDTPGKKITNNTERIRELIGQGYKIIDLVFRWKAQQMAAADLGRHWEELAEGPTLMRVDRVR